MDPGFTGEHARARDIWHFQTTSESAGVAEKDELNFAPDAKVHCELIVNQINRTFYLSSS